MDNSFLCENRPQILIVVTLRKKPQVDLDSPMKDWSSFAQTTLEKNIY